MSESDDAVRGSNVRELNECEAYQSSVARAFFSTDPVSEQGAFGDHDVVEALSSGSKDQLLRSLSAPSWRSRLQYQLPAQIGNPSTPHRQSIN